MNKKLIWIGGGLVGAFVIYKSKAAATTSLTSSTGATASNALTPGESITQINAMIDNGIYPFVIPGAPPLPSAYNDIYYQTYIYPTMVAWDKNITNPNYTLTDEQLMQYADNYLEIRQWLPTVVPGKFPSDQAALQWHWSTYGVPYKYTYLPLYPPKDASYVPPPVAVRGSSETWTIIGDVIKVGSTVVAAAAAGVNAKLLNNSEIELVVTSGWVLKNVLPLFAKSDNMLVSSIDKQLDAILTTYDNT